MEQLQDFPLKIELFDPLTASEDLWNQFFIYNEILEKEEHPKDPYPSREYIKKWMKDITPYGKNYRWIVRESNDGSKIIGYGATHVSTDKNPNYDTTKNVSDGWISVLPKYRRRGIGKKLLFQVVNKAREENRSIFQSGAVLDCGREFLKFLLGENVMESAENRLYLENVDWELMDRWRRNGKFRAKNVSIETFNDLSEEDIDEYMEIYTETMNQQPFGGLEGRYKGTPETRRHMEKRFKDKGIEWITKITRESDGRISGLTEIFYSDEESHLIQQMLTGVKERYRGRGLGKWLKSEMMFLIKEKYPKASFLSTGNADSNAPMLSINNRMGFKRELAGTSYKWEVKKLLEMLKE